MNTKLFSLALFLFALVGCGGDSSNSQPAPTDAPTPQVGETWYVQDHAYTDEVYEMIRSNGTATWPAQTSDNEPDKSFHLGHPYPCKVSEVGDNGFFKCTVDSQQTLDVTSVWTDHLMNAKDADARDPGSVIHKTVAAPAGSPSWLRIKTGQPIFTGYDGGDSTTVTVCSTHAAYDAFSAGATGNCAKHAPGIAAHIVSWEDDYTTDGKTNFPVVKIAADDGSWSGYTGSLVAIQPHIPTGTVLYARNDGNSIVRCHASKADNLNAGPALRNRTGLRLVRQDAKDVQNYDLLTRVADGPNAGKTCWVLTSEVEGTDRSPIIMAL